MQIHVRLAMILENLLKPVKSGIDVAWIKVAVVREEGQRPDLWSTA